MRNPSAKKRDDWARQLAPDFKCACGCELQLSRKDLADAIRVAAVVGSNPRTYGVELRVQPKDERARPVDREPMESKPCPRCKAPVEIPVFAAALLHSQRATWPTCSECRNPNGEQHHAREYWE